MKKYENIRADILGRMIQASFSGYDPSAINFSNRAVKIKGIIQKIPNEFLKKILNSLYSRTIYFLGGYSVFLLKPEKKIYAKGLALVLSGLSYDKTLNNNLVKKLVDQLFSMRIKDTYLWAHDIDYSFPGGQIVTIQTPNLVTTAFVANAFFDLYKKNNNEAYKDTFNKIVEELLGIIPYKVVSGDKLCFMYTPVTGYYVHNANLLYAELLAKKLYLESSRSAGLKDLVEKALNYSISDFNKTGTYPYAGPPTPKLAIDNYHTGYLLRSLNEINQIVGNDLFVDLDKEIEKLLNFYVGFFIRDGYVVRDNEKTIQSHSLAEAILIFKIFEEKLGLEERILMQNAIHRTLDKLYEKKYCYFINNAKRIGPFFLKDKTEMVRWSNAWMYYALSWER